MRLLTRSMIVALWAVLAGADAASAQDAAGYPDRPVRLVVPFPSAGAMDSIARILGERIGAEWGQQIVVDNRPGAGGNIGSSAVAEAEPDGYTLLMVSIGHAVNPSLYAKMPFDPVQDFAPVTLVATVPNLLVVHPSVPATSVAELIALAKEQPGSITYASAGYGTSIHLAGELFKTMAGVDMVHIPYKGSGPAVTDLVGGHVQAMFDSVTSALPHVRAGNLKALGVTSAKRSSLLPEVPTIAEAGLPGYEIDPWFGILAPAGTPAAIIVQIQSQVAQALALPEVQEKLAAIGAEPIGSTPEAFSHHLAAETAKWEYPRQGSGDPTGIGLAARDDQRWRAADADAPWAPDPHQPARARGGGARRARMVRTERRCRHKMRAVSATSPPHWQKMRWMCSHLTRAAASGVSGMLGDGRARSSRASTRASVSTGCGR